MPVKKEFNPLMDKKIEIVPRKKASVSAMFKSAPDENDMLTGTTRTIRCPVNRDIGGFVNPLNEEEAEFLENKLGKSFNIYKDPVKCFWNQKESTIKFRKTGKSLETAYVILDLSNPLDFAKYKMALINPRVANSWADRDNPSTEFVIRDLDAEILEKVDKTKVRSAVMRYLVNNENNFKKLYDFSRLYGNNVNVKKKPATTSSTEWIYSQLVQEIADNRNVKIMYDILQLDEKKLSLKVFVEDAIDSTAITRTNSKYSIQGVDTPFYSVNEVINFLENKANQEVKLRITAQVEKYQKTINNDGK